MDTSRRAPARPLAVIAALLLAVLSVGVAGSAAADPGKGKSGDPDQASSAQGPPAPSGQAKSDRATAAKSSGSAKPAKSGGAARSGRSDHSTGNASTQGSSDQPQPQSGADQNSGGANGQCPGGPYCSTRDGSPSLNGSPQGTAKGRPCAGCVGKADNKNPKGQNPDGSDNNAGYECDRNHGIGRSNPAHTGCVTTPLPGCETEPWHCPPPPGCETDPAGCPPPPGCRGDAAWCDPHHHTPHRPPVVLGTEASRHPRAGSGAGAASVGVLPATGAGATVPLLPGGTALVAVGSALMAKRRKRLAS